ncbi:translation initiation factor SUI1 [Malaciobacter halophilus]|uniref:Translation initiation factor SUI1 n=1 Tax=Malaciobacter halophilus TaxID=197482 RepID=A0A2N1J1N0_9BACT|nr:translation initiation factor SUI1 [Malaciobacter halophilus]AXH08632.1 eIF1/SUI1 family translation initiation factor [Malaciobacter halophilus]PKI80477.1 translation initiation factor SUI1 [Malaciobacter halophilus]
MIFEMGANLQGDNFDTKKEDKKKKPKQNIEPKNKHQLVFTFEKRKGKPVTLLGRFYLVENEKKQILKLLKKKLACGGSIKDEWIELQGDVKTKVKEILENEGWKFK